MTMYNVPDEAYEIGLLNREYHARLFQQLDKWASIAGVSPNYVWTKMSTVCTDNDIKWVKRFKKTDWHGLVYVGEPATLNIAEKMMTMVGCCLRNYVDGRFMTLQTIIQLLKDDEMPEPTIVFVPNFCDLMARDKKLVTSVQSSALLGWLYSRLSKGQKTIMYIGSMDAVRHCYGASMAAHLASQYVLIQQA